MTDAEFKRLLRRNLTLTADFKRRSYGASYVQINLVSIPDRDDPEGSAHVLGSIRIDASDFDIESGK